MQHREGTDNLHISIHVARDFLAHFAFEQLGVCRAVRQMKRLAPQLKHTSLFCFGFGFDVSTNFVGLVKTIHNKQLTDIYNLLNFTTNCGHTCVRVNIKLCQRLCQTTSTYLVESRINTFRLLVEFDQLGSNLGQTWCLHNVWDFGASAP